jgi:hypothetical protein
MIMELCRKNFIPYFQNFTEVLVNPEDIQFFLMSTSSNHSQE